MKKIKVLSEYEPEIPLLEQLLDIRGFVTEKNKKEFLEPPLVNEYVNSLSKELKSSLVKAKNLILDEIGKNTKIIIYGDYDADGVCATAVLFSTIKKELNHENIEYFIPNRFEHGYGLSLGAIKELVKNSEDDKFLLITVDTGITAFEEVKYLKKLGHKVILTDHHQKPQEVPEPDVLVWYDKVAGCTLSWLLSKTLGSKNDHNLALAALATVTDLISVTGINRSILKKGLEIINKDPPLSLKKIIEVAQVNSSEVESYHLGWIVGPRLNASGRLVSAEDSIDLLLEDDPLQAEKLARKLNEINLTRQDKTLEMYELAMLDDEDHVPNMIFSYDDKYHEGVIGLVAAKLVQKYYRPAVVISLDGDVGKGSVRSIPGINIIDILREFEEMFVNVGGHPMAAGFTIEKKNIKKLEDKLLDYAANNFSDEVLVPEIEVDMKIPMSVIDVPILDEIDKMKPFGVGNNEPDFFSDDVGILELRKVGKEKNHNLFKFFYDGKNYKGIWFNSSDNGMVFKLGDKADVVYTLKRNEFNGKVSVDLFIKDMKKCIGKKSD